MNPSDGLVIERVSSTAGVDALAALERESFTNPWTRQMYLAELDHPERSRLYLARRAGGEAVAFCACWFVVDELHVHNVAVRPAYRGRGVGTALLRHVLHEGARSGLGRAMLEVRASNVGARRLYERLGFVLRAVRRGYYSSPEEDALVLELDDLTRSVPPPL